MTDDLVAFLKARLDDDERVAQAATAGPWSLGGEPVATTRGHPLVVVGTDDRWIAGVWPIPTADSEHIARHDPARVLREVEAKRQIVDECDDIEPNSGDEYALAMRVLRALTMPYSDHADYRAKWNNATRSP